MSDLAGLALDAFWKSSLILGSSLLVSVLPRRPSAAFRCALILAGAAAFAAAVAAPCLGAFAPARIAVPAALSPIGRAAAPDRAVEGGPSPATARGVAAAAVAGTAAAPAKGRASFDAGAAIGAAWLAGMALLAAWGAIARVAASARPTHPADRSFARMLAAEEAARRVLGLRRRPALLVSDASRLPFVRKAFRPEIVFPAEAEFWSEADLEAAFAHELAHVKRRDLAADLFLSLLLLPAWMSPLSWLALRAFRLAREEACDDLAARAGRGPAEYAASLLSLGARPAVDVAGACGISRSSDLERRILALISGGPCPAPRPAPRRARRLALVLLAAACVATATAVPAVPAAGFDPFPGAVLLPRGAFSAARAGDRIAVTLIAGEERIALSCADGAYPGRSALAEADGPRPTLRYGPTVNPMDGSEYAHRGLDVAVRRGGSGAAVLAMAAGLVADVGADPDYGEWVLIDHGEASSFYAHLGSRGVVPGQGVEAGQAIGTLGNTGRSTGPHVHIEIAFRDPARPRRLYRVDPEEAMGAFHR